MIGKGGHQKNSPEGEFFLTFFLLQIEISFSLRVRQRPASLLRHSRPSYS